MEVLTLHDELSLISKGLYRYVSEIVGPECIVRLRRKGWDFRDDFENCDSSNEDSTVTSGSRGDGFYFKSSDFDIMSVHRRAICLTNSVLLTSQYDNIPTIYLLETKNVPPGYAIIKCLKYDQNNIPLTKALIERGDGIYLSSKQMRESYLPKEIAECYGPCQTIRLFGNEGDHAFALRCPVWPNQAISFVRRSLRRGWPSQDTLTNICDDGCLLVPINSRQQERSDMDDLEWQISFSLAEKKLIYHMNYFQFLCYGLSKLFLNEVIKRMTPIDDWLCSFFMKTAIFWEICDNANDWSQFTFLSKFWNVFRRLIKWVSIGYCPNFFIPENNMFSNKVYGERQHILLSILRELHRDGYWILLRCPSLKGKLSNLIIQPEIAYSLSIEEMEYVPLEEIEKQRLNGILQFDIIIDIESVEKIKSILKNTLSMMNRVALYVLRLRVNHVLQAYAQSLIISERNSFTRNRMNYKGKQRKVKLILLRTKTYFCMNYFILIKHIYSTKNYYKTIELTHHTRSNLKSQPYMYKWNLDADIIMGALQQGMSYDKVVNKFIVRAVNIDEYTAIEELKYERMAVSKAIGGSGVIFIPPLVFIDFILILCYTRIGERHERQKTLDYLHVLLYNDDGYHIHESMRAISWEILGICLELCGDIEGAYVSFLHALNEEYNYFKTATIKRIIHLYDKRHVSYVKCMKMDNMITTMKHDVL